MQRNRESGFTLIEVLVAIMLCSIAMIGIVALYRAQLGASGFSRRTTEATVIAEDKIERLRTQPGVLIGLTTETGVDELGKANVGGPFTRQFSVTPITVFYAEVYVEVSWNEDGPRSVIARSRRNLQ